MNIRYDAQLMNTGTGEVDIAGCWSEEIERWIKTNDFAERPNPSETPAERLARYVSERRLIPVYWDDFERCYVELDEAPDSLADFYSQGEP